MQNGQAIVILKALGRARAEHRRSGRTVNRDLAKIRAFARFRMSARAWCAEAASRCSGLAGRDYAIVEWRDRLQGALRGQSGPVGRGLGLQGNAPQLRVVINRDRAADLAWR